MQLKKFILKCLKVIISEARTFYLDHPHESCSHERGLRWATQKIDEFDIFMYSPPQVCSSKEDNCKEMDHILGIISQQSSWEQKCTFVTWTLVNFVDGFQAINSYSIDDF